MIKIKNRVPVAGAKGFSMSVMPAREHLDKAINQDGFCDPAKCWHKVAIAAIADGWKPGGPTKVVVDAGHIKMTYRGWRYVADTPRHVKLSLMLFDKKRYDDVNIRNYTLRFHRVKKVEKMSEKDKIRINANRELRVAAGSDERTRRYPDMRKRVEGFSSIV
jgi:hypothetical protein